VAMKMMRAAEFKARCLEVTDQVRATREPVIITKHGKSVAKFVPTSKLASFPRKRESTRGK